MRISQNGSETASECARKSSSDGNGVCIALKEPETLIISLEYDFAEMHICSSPPVKTVFLSLVLADKRVEKLLYLAVKLSQKQRLVGKGKLSDNI